MSDSSLWLLSTVLDFVEIIILKSSPTLHLTWYAIFENLFFIRFCSFFIILCCDSEFEPVFERAHFGTDFAPISLRLDIFGLKQTEAKEIILK